MGYSQLATFNVFEPHDALRLRLLVSNVLKHSTFVTSSMEDACPGVLESMKNGTFHCWKQSKVIREQIRHSELKSSIQSWRDGLGRVSNIYVPHCDSFHTHIGIEVSGR
jgi:hypothetical protein